ncbi:MAG: hypothetical protein JWM78_2718 [Verrucomicrobiaceae bacterium]|nr:hypothetical protein [Verrucomicrobiaceae bacterium]
MNYLAHFHLARRHDDWIAGALLGDFVKGPLHLIESPLLREGIQLHRRIDAFSDVHPLRAQFASLLPNNFRRYAGILLDVCCDYWLTRYWAQFETQLLPDFAQRVYAVLERHPQQISEPAALMAQRLDEFDVLTRYGDREVVAETLVRIGARLRRDNPLRYVRGDIDIYLAASESIFLALYPQLIAHVDALGINN